MAQPCKFQVGDVVTFYDKHPQSWEDMDDWGGDWRNIVVAHIWWIDWNSAREDGSTGGWVLSVSEKQMADKRGLWEGYAKPADGPW